MKKPKFATLSRAAGVGPAGQQPVAAGPDARVPAALLIIGGILAVAGSILPWETVSSSSGVVNHGGLETSDAAISLALGVLLIVGGLIAFRRRPSGYWRGMLSLVSIVVLGVFLLDANELHSSTTAFNAQVAGKAVAGLGIGLYVLAVAPIVAMVGVIRLPGAKRSPVIARSAAGRDRRR